MAQAGHSNTVPFLVACTGIATFAAMDGLMKGLSIEMGAYNAMLWRTAIAFVAMLPVFLWRRSPWPAQQVLRLHVWRGLVISVMAVLFFRGLALVPLAEAIALSFIAPLIALYLAAAMLGEKINSRAVVASVLGFGGAVVVISGKIAGTYEDEVLLGIAAILASAVLYAYNLILQRRQALLAGPVEIVVFQSGTLVCVYLLFAPWWAVLPGAELLPALCGAAVFSVTSILLLSWAYARAEARVLLPVEYTAFAWAALFGWLIYAEALTLVTVAGTALIIAGCLLAARQRPDRVEHVETTSV